MTSRLFRVDMSEGSRDFVAVATEPGLAMLDGTGANYGILRRWLGILVAEPELQPGELVGFYVRDPERGRLENLVCHPVRQKDLRGPLKEELEALAAGIRKAKPESANERLLHKIAAKTLKDQTADLDKSDFDCYFFKYRQKGGPWRLVWCWGYQRRDHEPSRAVICTNLECHRLFAHRPKTKRRCPVCQTIAQRKRRGPLAGVGLSSWLLLLLLALLLGAFFYPPRLVVVPGQWSGPPGSRVDFQVAEQRWLLFNTNVTDQVVPQSEDTRVIEFDHNGTEARAKASGRTNVTFRLGDRTAVVAVEVGAAQAPQAIRIEPSAVHVAVGSTAPVKVMGTYAGAAPVDVTDSIHWQVSDPKLAAVRNGRIEGTAPGKAKLTARYPGSDGNSVETSIDVDVTAVDYTALDVKLEPTDEVGVGQHMRVNVTGRDAAGKTYELTGSSRLTLAVEPRTAATLEGEYLVGAAPGKAKIMAVFDKLTQSKDFVVKAGSSLAGTLVVKPSQVDLFVGEAFTVDVAAANPAEVRAESSDPAVVAVLGSRTLSAHAAGQAVITFSQTGQPSQTVKVTVKPADYQKVEIRPATVALSVGETRRFDVVGVMSDGRSIVLATDQLSWLRQPQSGQVELRRGSSELVGQSATATPQPLEVQFAKLAPAVASVTVAGGLDTGTFEVFGPIALTRPGTVVNVSPQVGGPMRFLTGQGLVVDKVPDGSLLSQAGLVPGSSIGSINGQDITGLAPAAVSDLLEKNPLGNGTTLGYTDPKDVKHEIRLGIEITPSQPVQLLGTTASNATATSFDAAVRIKVVDKAEYRVVDESGKPLGPSSTLGPNAEGTLNLTQIPRTAGRTKYDMSVEWQSAGNVKRLAFTITLTASPTNPKP